MWAMDAQLRTRTWEQRDNLVWLCIPSARPAAEANEVIARWRAQGYNLALWREKDHLAADFDVCVTDPYPGYGAAVNFLARLVFQIHTACNWVVWGGDDTLPDPSKSASEIAAECSAHFSARYKSCTRFEAFGRVFRVAPSDLPTFGIMQPTGDRWGDVRGAYIDRVAGSPFCGRSFARLMNRGQGPLREEYWHMFDDEELQTVCQALGCLWQRRDLVHLHNHWARPRGSRGDMPAFAAEANSPEHWRKVQALFNQRRVAGFPGFEPTSQE